MLVSSRIQKRICIFNKISLFQWPETTHSAFEKKFFFLKFPKKNFSSNLAELWSEKEIYKNSKKKFWKKIFFFSHFFFENRNKIAKNRSIKTMVTIPNWQDFEVFRTYWFFWIWASFTIVNWQKTQKNFQFFFLFSNVKLVNFLW